MPDYSFFATFFPSAFSITIPPWDFQSSTLILVQPKFEIAQGSRTDNKILMPMQAKLDRAWLRKC